MEINWDTVNKVIWRLRQKKVKPTPKVIYHMEKSQLTESEKRVKIVSPRIKFLTLHCLFSEGKNSDWMKHEDEDGFIKRIVNKTQSMIDLHHTNETIGFKKQYLKTIYYKEGLNDNDYQRMYQNRLGELDLQAGRKRQKLVLGS